MLRLEKLASATPYGYRRHEVEDRWIMTEATEKNSTKSDEYIYSVIGHYRKSYGEEKAPFNFTIESSRTFQVYDFNLLLINLSGKLSDERGIMPNPNEIVITKLELLDQQTE